MYFRELVFEVCSLLVQCVAALVVGLVSSFIFISCISMICMIVVESMNEFC